MVKSNDWRTTVVQGCLHMKFRCQLFQLMYRKQISNHSSHKYEINANMSPSFEVKKQNTYFLDCADSDRSKNSIETRPSTELRAYPEAR